jgi:glycosyltransferase involved in cell wall biosynthesis
MRFLFLNHNYRGVGTYFRAMPMAERLAQRGHAVSLMTVSRGFRILPNRVVRNGVRVFEMPNLGFDKAGEGYGIFDNFMRLGHSLITRYDLVHAFDHKPNVYFAGRLGQNLGATLIADWSDWWGDSDGINEALTTKYPRVGRFDSNLETQQKRFADGVVTISAVLHHRAVAIGCPVDRVIHIPTGAATDRIKPLPIDVARQKLNVPMDRLLLGFIGVSQTDLEIVFQAMRSIPEAWLMLIGDIRAEVSRLAHSFGVAERLWQTGRKDGEEVSLYLACADVMVMPMKATAGNRGRLPNKILDYLAAGKPIVANPVGDVKDIIERHRCGTLADDTDQFANAIRTLWDAPNERLEMGRRARAIAESEYGWTPLIDKLEQFYDKIHRARRTSR